VDGRGGEALLVFCQLPAKQNEFISSEHLLFTLLLRVRMLTSHVMTDSEVTTGSLGKHVGGDLI